MADEGRHPVAIRIARPYPSEEAFLEHELDTLTRTSVVLLGAQSRPQGVVLRFEVTLASGAPLLRGEGRVVGYKANALNDEPGLTLRFTRLDPRSKALIDRAAALRDARARGGSRSEPPLRPMPPAPEAHLEATHAGPPPSMARPSSVPAAGSTPTSGVPTAPPPAPPPSMPPASSQATPIPSAVAAGFEDEESPSKTTMYDRDMIDRLRSERLAREVADMPPPTNIGSMPGVSDAHASEPPPAAFARRSAPPRSSSPPRRPSPPNAPNAPNTPAPPPTVVPGAPPTRTADGAFAPPPDRDALLERLRARARDLPPVRVRQILDSRRT